MHVCVCFDSGSSVDSHRAVSDLTSLQNFDIQFITDFFNFGFFFYTLHQNMIDADYWVFWRPLKFYAWGKCLTHLF